MSDLEERRKRRARLLSAIEAVLDFDVAQAVEEHGLLLVGSEAFKALSDWVLEAKRLQKQSGRRAVRERLP